MSNTLVPQNNNTGVSVKTLPSYEAAKMMEREHAKVLKMLEGETYKDGRTKVVGIIPTLTKARTRVSDYFIESTYKDASGKQNKYYECTKMGCELLANKMTGEKGILFTARYVKKFNDMEQTIDQQTQMINKQYEDRLDRLESMVTTMVKSFTEVVEKLAITTKVTQQPKSEQLTFDTLDLPYTATNIGKKINRTASVTNKILLQRGILSVKDGSWTLNKQYENKGWGKTVKGQYRGKTYVRYTEKGMQEIVKIFK